MERITEYCTGCRACEQVCKELAITFTPDKEGFLSPNIDRSKCIDCGLCSKICPQNNDVFKNVPIRALGLRYKDDHEIKKCASGGVFTALALTVFKSGGVVSGVAYDDNLCAKHIIACKKEDLKRIQGSKYVQADCSSVYTEIKNLLNAGRFVLFSGTGCQVAGLKRFLRKDYDNLLTIDLICHGVTSPLMFKKYIEWESKRIQASILDFNFRSKENGWGLTYTYTYYSRGRVRKKNGTCYNNVYYKHFLDGDAYRECCYSCNYCRPERTGDFTIGDFWGVERFHLQFYSSKGVSSILVNTTKGNLYLEKHLDLFYNIETTFDIIALRNTNLIKPTHRNAQVRDIIYDGIYEDNWFDNLVKNEPKNIMTIIKSIVPLRLRRFINMFILKIRTIK
jgi:coenzyme F420-reducing hydrogenase beta subunit